MGSPHPPPARHRHLNQLVSASVLSMNLVDETASRYERQTVVRLKSSTFDALPETCMVIGGLGLDTLILGSEDMGVFD